MDLCNSKAPTTAKVDFIYDFIKIMSFFTSGHLVIVKKGHSLILWPPLNNKNTLLRETHKLDPLRRGAVSREPLVFLCQYRETYNISDKVTPPPLLHPTPANKSHGKGKQRRQLIFFI